jgi:hypothetical protein
MRLIPVGEKDQRRRENPLVCARGTVGISVDSSDSLPVSSSSPVSVLGDSAMFTASSIPSQTLPVSTDSVGVSATSDMACSDLVFLGAVPLLPSENHPSAFLSLPNHVRNDVWNRDHFFIPCVLRFPGRKVIKTYAFVDCEALLSHIYEQKFYIPDMTPPSLVILVAYAPLTSSNATTHGLK